MNISASYITAELRIRIRMLRIPAEGIYETWANMCLFSVSPA